eukprot:5589397-Prymnesium_polylepis.1
MLYEPFTQTTGTCFLKPTSRQANEEFVDQAVAVAWPLGQCPRGRCRSRTDPFRTTHGGASRRTRAAMRHAQLTLATVRCRERLAKEKARQPEVVPLPRGSLRSIPSPRFAAQFASPRSTYQEFCRNRPEPKIVNRKVRRPEEKRKARLPECIMCARPQEISASFDPEAEARRQLELR